jgi:hypothetical protein
VGEGTEERKKDRERGRGREGGRRTGGIREIKERKERWGREERESTRPVALHPCKKSCGAPLSVCDYAIVWIKQFCVQLI